MTANTRDKSGSGNDVQIESFSDYQVIRQPNPLKAAVKPAGAHHDDPVARAEKALEKLSVEFDGWMQLECDQLAAAHAAIVSDGINDDTTEELLRAALHIKGNAATFGYPMAAAAADSLCRIIEYAPDFAVVPTQLIGHHVNAVQAIIREHKRFGVDSVASELSRRLRSVADEYLIAVNKDRPELLEILGAPSIVPAG
jgi:hypothetical protein